MAPSKARAVGEPRAVRDRLTLYQAEEFFATRNRKVGYQTLAAAYKKGNGPLKAEEVVVTGPKRNVPLFTEAELLRWDDARSQLSPEKVAAYLGIDVAQAAQLREQYLKTGKTNKITP